MSFNISDLNIIIINVTLQLFEIFKRNIYKYYICYTYVI